MGYEAGGGAGAGALPRPRLRRRGAAVPLEFIDQTSLLGPMDRIVDGLQAFRDVGVTTLSVSTFAPTLTERLLTLRTIAEAAERAGVLA